MSNFLYSDMNIQSPPMPMLTPVSGKSHCDNIERILAEHPELVAHIKEAALLAMQASAELKAANPINFFTSKMPVISVHGHALYKRRDEAG
jgi:hypothetical protein